MGNKIVITIGLWLFSLLIMSGQGIPIQLMVVDADGFEKVNHDVKLRLTMSNDTSSTTGQYQEVHITQSNEFGIVSVEMGSGISTTNSQVLGISQFSFSDSEPFIKVELDTSQSLNQYYEVGHVPYSYPLISRRAFKADSADFANQSTNSVFADTAEFARTFVESIDFDTSSTNELQDLTLSSNGYLKLTKSPDSVLISSGNKSGISNLTSYQNRSGCFQGNPEVYDLSILDGYSFITPQIVFDSVAFISARLGTGSSAVWFLFKVDLNNSLIISTENLGSSGAIYRAQSDSIAYMWDATTIYKINSIGTFVDTITTSLSLPYSAVVHDNGDLCWLGTNTIYTLNSSTGNITSVVTASSFNGGLRVVGSDSILVGNKLYNSSTGTVLKSYNFTDAVSYKFYYSRQESRILYYVHSSPYRWYHCDLEGNDSKVFLWGNGDKISTSGLTIEGTLVFETSIQGSYNYNGYITNLPPPAGSSGYIVNRELLSVDIQGVIYQIMSPHSFEYLYQFGKYTACFSSGYQCVTGSDIFTPNKLIRWAR